MEKTRKKPALAARILPVWLAIAGLAAAAAPGTGQILDPQSTKGGQFQTATLSLPENYYLLQRSAATSGPWQPVALQPGTGGRITLTDAASFGKRAFYRIQSVPSATPLDSDLDGTDDLTEWRAGSAGNPFNPAAPASSTDAAIILRDPVRFEKLAHRDNFPGASNVREVKFLVMGADTSTPRLYFLNTNLHQYHYYFAHDVLGYQKDLSTFNNETYFTDSRRQIAGSLVYYPHYTRGTGSTGLFAVEFWPSDGISHRHVRMAFDLVSSSLPWMDRRLAYHPAGLTQEQRLASEPGEWRNSTIDVISSDELFAATTYSVLNPGVCFGRLVIGGGATAVSARDIVVLPAVPADLSRVAGIITATPQTPLSHINLKAKQNGTPNCFLRGALSDPRITALAGKNVRLEVSSDGLEIREATSAEVDTWLDALRPPEPQFPVRDLSVIAIRPLGSVSFADSRNVGAKAANVAELKRVLPVGMSPDGWAVPFSFYHDFMEQNGFYAFARSMVEDPDFKADPAIREARLEEFRGRLLKGIVSPPQQYALAVVQAAFAPGVPIRCRSSTNNEDLPGFNGAGLYDSNTHRPEEGSLHKSVRKVWASLWNFRAFEEREFHRIDHFSAAMGVLLHPNEDDELANGVAVSRNLIDPNWRGYYVNVQKGEELVTNPDQSVIPEEFLISSLMGQTRYEIQHVTFSSLQPPRTSLLSTFQAWDLADRLLSIQYHFRTLYDGWSDPDFAMEIEFKITKDNKLSIKQARPWVN